jgi:hypothetical protein
MKTDDYVERERKKFIAKQDLLEQAQIGVDNELLLWVMMYGREPVEDIIVGKERVDHINILRKRGYITSDWSIENTWNASLSFKYVLTKKAEQRLEHLSKRHNRSIKK